MLPRDQLLEYVRTLGREFSRRKMHQHVRRLRVYYLAVKRGLTPPSHELDVKWTEPFVIEWMKTLGVPPFERAYEVRPPGAGCDRCPGEPGQAPIVFTDFSFPGGSRRRCQRCGRVWLERG